MVVDKTLNDGSNNISELWAICEALIYAKSRKFETVEIYTDSKNNLAWLDHRVGQGLNDRFAVLNLFKTIDELRTRIS